MQQQKAEEGKKKTDCNGVTLHWLHSPGECHQTKKLVNSGPWMVRPANGMILLHMVTRTHVAPHIRICPKTLEVLRKPRTSGRCPETSYSTCKERLKDGFMFATLLATCVARPSFECFLHYGSTCIKYLDTLGVLH